MNYILVKFSADYADEFNVDGFAIFEQGLWNDHLRETKKFFKSNSEVEEYFGTNEAISFYDFDDYKRSFSTRDIDLEEIKSMRKLFGITANSSSGAGVSSYGHFLMLNIEERNQD